MWLIVAIPLLFVLVAWLATTRVYGGIPARLLLHMFRLVARGRQRIYLSFAIFFLAYGILTAFDPTWFPVSATWLFATALVLFVHTCLPPAFLFVGSSHLSGSILRQAQAAAIPLRLVHLLAPMDGESAGETAWKATLRTRKLAEWRRVVDELALFVPYVIADTQVDTPALCDEIKMLLATPRRAYTTLFVTGPDGRHPALNAVTGGSIPSNLAIVKPAQLAVAVRALKQLPVDSVGAWHEPS